MTPDSKQRKKCDTYDVVRPDRGVAGNVRADHHLDAPGVAEAPPALLILFHAAGIASILLILFAV